MLPLQTPGFPNQMTGFLIRHLNLPLDPRIPLHTPGISHRPLVSSSRNKNNPLSARIFPLDPRNFPQTPGFPSIPQGFHMKSQNILSRPQNPLLFLSILPADPGMLGSRGGVLGYGKGVLGYELEFRGMMGKCGVESWGVKGNLGV